MTTPTPAASPAEFPTEQDRARMLDIVKRTLAYGLTHGKPPEVDLKSFPDALTRPGATFVTVEKSGRLRGCIGTLQAYRPLITDLVENAFRAGFKDPRFPPLTRDEMHLISWSISILSEPEVMLFRDEADLLSQLKPGIDGLILQDGSRRATFLPQVWEQLPDPKTFLAHLKRKAGLPPDHWSEALTVQRYRVEKVG